MKAGLGFGKDVLLVRNTQRSGVEKEPNSRSQTSCSNMGAGIMMIVSWLRKGLSGVRQLVGLLFGESLLSCDLRSQNREEALRRLLLAETTET